MAGPVAGLVAHAGARARLLVRVALVALEWSSFPRRFSRLAPERRARHMRRLEAAGGPRRDVLHLLKALSTMAWARDPRAAAAVGVRARCEATRAEAAAEPPPLDAGDLSPPEGEEACDVVVVGSGAGGAAAARVLAGRGLDVRVLEEGPYVDRRRYLHDPLEALPLLYRGAGLTFAEGRPAIPLPVGRCVGGTTVINSGTCLPAPERVLGGWQAGHGIEWAEQLGPEMEQVERDLRVEPVDPAAAGRNAALCRAGAEALGVEHSAIRRNAPGVTRCGTCPTGCAIDAKRAVHVEELPQAVAAGARVHAGARVEEILLGGGRALGVRGRDFALRARAVVAAAGALGTPELLQRSGVRSPVLGRHLHVHPACWVGARFDEDVRGWDGVMQSWHVGEWAERGLFLEATFTPLAFGAHWLPGTGATYAERVAAFDRLAVIGVHLAERHSSGRVRAGRVTYRLDRADSATLRFGIARAAELLFAAGAREVYPQVAGLDVLRPGEQHRLEDDRIPPAALRLEAFHPMGTARLGADPRTSVASPSGETHDLPGLWIADASLLPTTLGVNPMVTIMACARRVAGELAERLGA